MNKKGIIDGLGSIMVQFFLFLLLFGMVSLLWFNIYTTGFVPLVTSGAIDASTLDKITPMNNTFIFLDRIIPLVFIFLWFSLLISTIRTMPVHPVFFFFNILGLTLITFLSIIFVDFGTIFFSNSVFTPVLSILGNTLFFAYNLHYISFGVGLISLIFYYRKTGFQESGSVFGGGNNSGGIE